jgi:phosphoserine phosphatase
MEAVLSLIAAPARYSLEPADIAMVREKLPRPGIPHWLAPKIACDIPFKIPNEMSPTQLRDAIGKFFRAASLDVNILSAQGRRKRLLVADMDSTIIGQECIDELADFIGERKRISAITERAMRGEIVFEDALRERVGLLKGMDGNTLEHIFREKIRLTEGAQTLVATMRAHGAYTALVSGGFTFFTGRVAKLAGFDMHRSNELVIQDGRLAGTVTEPILGRNAKLETLVSLRDQLGLAAEDTLAVGDGANDLAMIEAAGLGVAFHAKPVVAEKAKARLDHAGLAGLLYLQGYSAEEFINPA